MDIIKNGWPSPEAAALAAQSGDVEAAEWILEGYSNLVRSRARPYFLPGADREDLVQVGMIGLWRAIIDFKPEEHYSFPAFARCVVHRHIITAVKAHCRQKHGALNFAVSLTGSEVNEGDGLIDWLEADNWASAPSAEEIVVERETGHWLLEQVRRRLSQLEWNVLVLYMDGYSHKEIAQRLGVSVKSIDNSLARIKRKADGWSELDDIRSHLARNEQKWHGNRRYIKGAENGRQRADARADRGDAERSAHLVEGEGRSRKARRHSLLPAA